MKARLPAQKVLLAPIEGMREQSVLAGSLAVSPIRQERRFEPE